jgi:uncharacterized protein (TIGR03083 family)
MPELMHLADAAFAEALAFADLFDGLDAELRGAPTPCAAWSIDDLAAHVASGGFRDAEAFHRARLGSPSPPGELDLAGVDPAATIRSAVGHLRGALDDPPQRWPAVPMPFGSYPVADALRCLVIEFGVHLDDLKVAVGERHTAFSPATLKALFGFGDLYLLRQAAPLEADPFTFTLTAPSATMSVTWTGRRWTDGTVSARECRIAGSDDAIARLMLRRLDVTDPRIDLLDPHHLAPLYASAIRPL